MSYSRVYSSRINWKNTPSTATPLGQENLNKMDYAIYVHDSTIQTLDSNKANQSEVNSLRNSIIGKADQSDLLLTLKTVTYNPITGVFTFTHFNGVTYTVDLNVEKIPVSFTLDETGMLHMRTQDGQEFTCDLSVVIRTYYFLSSDTIRFSINQSDDGSFVVTANIIDGSITADKLQPNFLADVTEQAETASDAAQSAGTDADLASAAAILARSYTEGGTGTRPGEDTDNARYYKEQARAIVDAKGHTIIDSSGTVFNDRASLQFLNGDITDDQANDITKVLLSMMISDAEWASISALLQYMDNETTYDLQIPDDDWDDINTILV